MHYHLPVTMATIVTIVTMICSYHGYQMLPQSITVTVYCYKVKGLKSSLMGETKLLLPKDRHDTATEATGLASQLSFE